MQRIVEIFVGIAQGMTVVPAQKHEQSKQELAEEASDGEFEGKSESKQLNMSTSRRSKSPEGCRSALRRRSSPQLLAGAARRGVGHGVALELLAGGARRR
eukprot:13511285-Heterocapsa_arctica.AAC.1